jgi:hypothetical protein
MDVETGMRELFNVKKEEWRRRGMAMGGKIKGMENQYGRNRGRK